MAVSKRENQQTRKGTGSPLIKGGGLLPPKGKKPAPMQPVHKVNLERLGVEQLPKQKPDFQNSTATKDGLIAEWLTGWISTALGTGKLSENNLLPTKGEIAKYLGVSIGTVQNAIRFVEDEGHVESKQRIGTVIRDASTSDHRMRKQTSKRDQAVIAVQHLIVTRSIQPGEPLPSAREVAKLIGSAPNTTRLALEYLSAQGILQNQGFRGNKVNWYVQRVPDLSTIPSVQAIESETLIDQLERDLKGLISDRFNVNDKLPSHLELADSFGVSIKTVHDAMKRLADQGMVHSKRGRYGTFVYRKPDAGKLFSSEAFDVFLPAEEASFYNYQRVEQHLKGMLQEKYKVGDKLPPMGELADDMSVSSNTVRKALQNLGKSGYVTFTRGRYGGTFVRKLPHGKEAAKTDLKWVSVNPQTAYSYGSGKK